jgi:hypothetical protein
MRVNLRKFFWYMALQRLYTACLLVCLAAAPGCGLLPQMISQPTVHNPFPQLSRIAVAPFFNLSAEPTLDGRQVAISYFGELQLVPGFEVVPVGVVESAMRENRIVLTGPAEARKLAHILQVDAVVIGAITDYSPYYPPRCGLQIEWYAANPGFHPIPPGYGLPWGTHEEQDIPGPLVFEAEFALAQQQLKTQSPQCAEAPHGTPPPRAENGAKADSPGAKVTGIHQLPSGSLTPVPGAAQVAGNGAEGAHPGEPTYWPDPRGFIPPPPGPRPPTCWPTDAPVLRHTRVYNGNDSEFTAALANYYVSRDEARFDGWQGYLQRSEEFVRFCCHKHIWEMLTARGGAGESRVVWRWPTIR